MNQNGPEHVVIVLALWAIVFWNLPIHLIFEMMFIAFLDHCAHLQKLARRLIFGKWQLKEDVESEDGRKKISKFKESAWKCIYFLSAEVLALTVTYDEPWFTNTSNFWVGPGNQTWPDQKIKWDLKELPIDTWLLASIMQFES